MGWIDEPSVLPGKSEQVESLHCLYEVLFWKIFFFFLYLARLFYCCGTHLPAFDFSRQFKQF